MPGIIVGVDGSGHSQRALEWAMKEATLRHAPLTVLTVHETIRGYFGTAAIIPRDAELTEKAREAAQAEVEKVLAGLGESRPESVTVKAVNGFPVEELIKAGHDADMIVLGARGVGGFTQLMLGSVTSQVAHHATCPVLIVQPAHRDSRVSGPSGLRSSWPRGPRDAGTRAAAAVPRRTGRGLLPGPRASTAGHR